MNILRTNITFLRNEKILNLCLIWHILRSYRFLAEITFKTLTQPYPIHFLQQVEILFSVVPNYHYIPNSLIKVIFQNNFQAILENMYLSQNASELMPKILLPLEIKLALILSPLCVCVFAAKWILLFFF